jgi:hypothetical protein
LIPLSLAEICHLLHLDRRDKHVLIRGLHWSNWRRHHQADTRRHHLRLQMIVI